MLFNIKVLSDDHIFGGLVELLHSPICWLHAYLLAKSCFSMGRNISCVRKRLGTQPGGVYPILFGDGAWAQK